MAKESWLDSNHVRVTSEDGRTSYLYEDYIPGRVLDDLFWGGRRYK